MLKVYKSNNLKGDYTPDNASFAARSIKNMALGYLALTNHRDLVYKQFKTANNLTDRLSALSILVNNNLPEAEKALKKFYQMYEMDDLVLNKWFAVQARNISINTLETVKNLITHPKFDYKNPNKVRGLLGAFAGNLASFNTPEGYDFYAKECLKIDKINPHLAARLFTAFAKYRKFDDQTKASAKAVLQSVVADKSLSPVSRETVERML